MPLKRSAPLLVHLVGIVVVAVVPRVTQTLVSMLCIRTSTTGPSWRAR